MPVYSCFLGATLNRESGHVIILSQSQALFPVKLLFCITSQ